MSEKKNDLKVPKKKENKPAGDQSAGLSQSLAFLFKEKNSIIKEKKPPGYSLGLSF